MSFPQSRPLRLRRSEAMRALVRDVYVPTEQLILPIFFKAALKESVPVAAMPGHYQLSLADAAKKASAMWELGLRSVMIFGVPLVKDETGSDSFSDNGVVQQAIRRMKDATPDMLVMTDVCFCEYMPHGHCGALSGSGEKFALRNDLTLELLAKQALSHARAGSDVLAPSGMIDGAVGAIRAALDGEGFTDVAIMSHSVKFSSCLYGPFRHATEGAPQFGDRRSYQASATNRSEYIREVEQDIAQGSDFLMVKPAHTYLDVICRIKERYPEMPLAAYHPSGEFAMIKAAAEKGWVDEKKAIAEILTAIRRAGADCILTYFAEDVARMGGIL